MTDKGRGRRNDHRIKVGHKPISDLNAIEMRNACDRFLKSRGLPTKYCPKTGRPM